jgi:hypothetical protein
MAKTGARVHIYGDYDGAGVQKAKKDISTLDTQAKGFSKSFTSSFAGAGAAIGAAFGVGVIGANVLDFFQSSITAALADEKAMRSLEIALQNVGAAHQTGPIEGFIDALARETGVADDQLRPAFQRLVTATSDVTLSQNTLQLAMDISAGTGRDLEAVTLALTRAYTGSTTGLSRLGAGLDSNLLKSKDMDAITTALSEKFAGQASAAADTYQGKINKLSIAVDEGKELIGVALLNAVDDISEAFGGTGGMSDAVDSSAQAMADLITGISMSINPIADFVAGINKSTGSTFDFVDILKVAYLPFAPLIAKTEGFIDKAADARIQMEQQAAASLVLTSRLTGLAGSYTYATGAAINFGRYQSAPDGTDWANFYAVNQSGSKALAEAQNNVTQLTADYNESLKNVGTSSASAAKDTFAFKEALAQVNKEGLEKLNANLKVAQEEFDGFRKSVAGGLTGQLDFAGAVDAAKEGGTSIVDGISAQAGGIVKFGEQLQGLLKTELSEEAFTAVAALSAERGAQLAKELLSGNGAVLVEQLNTAVASVSAIADAVGLQSAEKFKGAGKKTAEDTIDAFKEFMGKDGLGRKRLMNTMDNLANAAAREVRIDVLVTRSVNEVVTRISSGTSSLTPMAAGGPVVGGRPYLIGEVGPELFVPSGSGTIVPNNEIGGGASNVYSITVNTGVGDPRVIGEEVVNVISRFEKANGAVFARA